MISNIPSKITSRIQERFYLINDYLYDNIFVPNSTVFYAFLSLLLLIQNEIKSSFISWLNLLFSICNSQCILLIVDLLISLVPTPLLLLMNTYICYNRDNTKSGHMTYDFTPLMRNRWILWDFNFKMLLEYR